MNIGRRKRCITRNIVRGCQREIDCEVCVGVRLGNAIGQNIWELENMLGGGGGKGDGDVGGGGG